jgi:thiamine pyrophosphokinase
MRVAILANGDPPSAELARLVTDQHDMLIATDGAAHKAAALGLAPALICGDFDSLDVNAARRQFPASEFVETPDQNLADLEKALLLARERGATEVTLLGASGGRIDHALTAVALLLRYQREIVLVLQHDGSTVRALSGTPDTPGRLCLATRPGDTISLIAFSPANRVSVSGVAWPLEDAPLPVGTHGVSNVAQGDSVNVEVREGVVLICHLFSEQPQIP